MLATIKEFLTRLWRSVHYGCAPLIDATLRLHAALAAGHEKIYARLVKQHVVVRLTLLVFLTLLHLAFIIPCVVWLIAGISGGFLWTSTLTLWDLAWIIWTSYNDVLCDCGRFASCSTDNSLAYIQAYFTALGQHPNSRTFHILFGIYVSLTAMYQAGLTMSLLMGTPVYRPVRSIAFAYGLTFYVFALWYLGLNGGIDPDTPCGFMILWWFGATLGYCLAWLAKHHRCEHLLVAALQCLIGMIVLGYVVGTIWPDFYDWWQQQLAALVGLVQQAYGRVVKVVCNLCARVGRVVFPRADCGGGSSKDGAGAANPDEPSSPCGKVHHRTLKDILEKKNRGEITAEQAVTETEKAQTSSVTCRRANVEVKQSLEYNKQVTKERDLADAQHEAELQRAKDASTPTAGTLASQGLTVAEKVMDVVVSVTGGKSGNTTSKSDEKQKKD